MSASEYTEHGFYQDPKNGDLWEFSEHGWRWVNGNMWRFVPSGLVKIEIGSPQ